jgi:hypothetical protein
MPLVAAACADPSQLKMRDIQVDLQRFVAATNDAVACRAAAAQNPRYRMLDEHMPLTNIGSASLYQMANPYLATRAEISALDAWSHDLNACREQLLDITNNTLPSFGPIIEAGANEDDATFVQLAEHKLAWGEAVMQLRINSTKLRAALITRADQVLGELAKLEQEQLNRRTTILSSIIRIFP